MTPGHAVLGSIACSPCRKEGLPEAEEDSAVSETNDQPAQQPLGGAAARGTTAAPPADATRGYVPRPAPGYDDVSAASDGPSGTALGLTILAAAFMMVSGVLLTPRNR
jgi:hypothetical protein